MKAMTLHQYGGPDVLQLEELPVLQPLAHEVRVKVHAVSIHPVDTRHRQNRPYTDFPVVLGWDISGVAEGAGEESTDVQVGDEVYAMIRFPDEGRAHAEYVVAPAIYLTRKPALLSYVEATTTLTTLALLTTPQVFGKTNLRSGQAVVLIHAGGVGHFAVQLIKARAHT